MTLRRDRERVPLFERSRLRDAASTRGLNLVGFPLQALAQLYVKALLVLRSTKPLMWGAFYAVFLNVLGNAVLMQWLGVAGIALATSGTAAFSALYVWRSLQSAFAAQASGLGGSDGDPGR